jgi:hypothetical protein
MDIQNKHVHTNKDKSREHEPLDNNDLIGATKPTLRIERKVHLT